MNRHERRAKEVKDRVASKANSDHSARYTMSAKQEYKQYKQKKGKKK
jgi:hypothetical protein